MADCTACNGAGSFEPDETYMMMQRPKCARCKGSGVEPVKLSRAITECQMRAPIGFELIVNGVPRGDEARVREGDVVSVRKTKTPRQRQRAAIEARMLLHSHGLLSDSEDAAVRKRIHEWAERGCPT